MACDGTPQQKPPMGTVQTGHIPDRTDREDC
jgi:hypothetical protein